MNKLWELYEEDQHPTQLRGSKKALAYLKSLTEDDYKGYYGFIYEEDTLIFREYFEFFNEDYFIFELESLEYRGYDGVDWNDWDKIFIDAGTQGMFIDWHWASGMFDEDARYNLAKDKNLGDVIEYIQCNVCERTYYGIMLETISKPDTEKEGCKLTLLIDKMMKSWENGSRIDRFNLSSAISLMAHNLWGIDSDLAKSLEYMLENSNIFNSDLKVNKELIEEKHKRYKDVEEHICYGELPF